MKVTFHVAGVETVHPAPGEKCNLDDARHVVDMTVGELIEEVITQWIRRGRNPADFTADYFDQRYLCRNCGGPSDAG